MRVKRAAVSVLLGAALAAGISTAGPASAESLEGYARLVNVNAVGRTVRLAQRNERTCRLVDATRLIGLLGQRIAVADLVAAAADAGSVYFVAEGSSASCLLHELRLVPGMPK